MFLIKKNLKGSLRKWKKKKKIKTYFSNIRNYRIYSSDRPGRSFNFWFSKGGAYSREAHIKYIKTLKYF